MKAVVCPQYGKPHVLKIFNIKKPEIGEHEVLIKVNSSAITTADTMMRSGTPWFGRLFLGLRKPKQSVIGTGFSGTVVSTGKSVTHFTKGDAVFGETAVNFGANAEYLAIEENQIILKKPDFLPFAEAAAFCDGLLTSYNFLKNLGEVKAGQKVLINGASGSLGMAAVQIAKALGAAEVVGVCSGRNASLVKELGATSVIDYTKKDFTKEAQKFDIVFDTLGKRSFTACKSILNENGIYLSPVLKLPILWQMLTTSKGKGKSALFDATGLKTPEQLKPMLIELLAMHQQGQISIPIEKSYPIEEIIEAHEHIESGRKRGNIVLNLVSLTSEKPILANNRASLA